MSKLGIAFFAGFFAVISLSIIFIGGGSNSASVISSLGSSLANLGASLSSGGQHGTYSGVK